jgi:ElaB/YqjD/DUF883 family membrane-anchored ribosome-binding protein
MKSTTEVKDDFKSKANGAQKNAKEAIDKAVDSAPEVIQTVTDLGKSFMESMTDSKNKAIETATSTIQSLDKALKARPWTFVGGAVVLGFTAGYLLARGKKSSNSVASIASGVKTGIDKIKDQLEQNINKVSEHLQ